MGRKARAKKEPKAPPVASPALRAAPNWPLLALSLVGILLAAYLSWTEWVGSTLKGCSAGSSCDTVLSSRWATLLGLPTAFWGLLTYATLAGSSFVRRADQHWWLAWTVAFTGLLYSAYLTLVSVTLIGATCPYCLTSLATLTAIFALVTVQRPSTLEGFSWQRWLVKTALPVLVLIALVHLNYTGLLGEPPAVDDPRARGLAIHLTEIGAKMYGSYLCPHCRDQKELFGAAASRLPYVECTGQGSAQATACRDAGIKNYPTWIINGTRTEGVMTLDQLAAASGFQMPDPAMK